MDFSKSKFLLVVLSFAIISIPLTLVAQDHSNLPVVASIVIKGNCKTRPGILHRELGSSVGKVFDWSVLEKDTRALRKLNIIRTAEAQVKRGKNPRERIILFVVSESFPWKLEPIFGNDSIFGIYGGFVLGYKNFRGLRENLTAEVRLGNRRRYAFQWSNPWYAGSLHLFSAINVWREEYKYLYKDYSPDFQEYNSGINFTLGSQLSAKLAVGSRFMYERVDVDDKSVSLSGSGVDELSAIEAFFELNTRNWELYPRNGWYIQGSARRFYVVDTHFDKAKLDIRRYQPLFSHNIIAVRLQMMLSRRELPVYKREHLGGGGTLRGYPRGEFGGDNTVAGSIEWRVPIGFRPNPANKINVGLAAVIFYDVGTAWWRQTRVINQRFHSSVGFGFHFILQEMVFSGLYGYAGRGFGFLHIASNIEF